MILIREAKNGTIYLRGHPTLRTFPLRKVRGCLFLEDCLLLRSLPPNLEVGEDFILDECHSLTRLPTTLRVGGTIWLQNTPVSELPDDLEVGEDLYLKGSKVTRVPKSARIWGQVYGLRVRWY